MFRETRGYFVHLNIDSLVKPLCKGDHFSFKAGVVLLKKFTIFALLFIIAIRT